jgi:hypothetical protein
MRLVIHYNRVKPHMSVLLPLCATTATLQRGGQLGCGANREEIGFAGDFPVPRFRVTSIHTSQQGNPISDRWV